MSRFVKLPVEIEAVQFTGDNWAEMHAFTGHRPKGYIKTRDLDVFCPIGSHLTSESDEKGFMLHVAELWVEANQQWLPIEKYEWIIKDRLGFYPCKDEVFRATYIEADEDPSFRLDLEHLINKHSLEGGSNTPDFILAGFLESCLDNWNHAVRTREEWSKNG